MAINTQTALIEELRYLTGTTLNTLTETDAVRLLNRALDHYSYIAITADGKWQFDDTENSDMPVATATLAANAKELELNTTFLSINWVEIQDSNGKRTRIEPFDRRFGEEVTLETTETGKPAYYDYNGGVITFDKYADGAYTVRVFFSRAANHLAVGSSNQVVGIPTIHTEYLVMYAMHRMGLKDANENRAQVRQELAMMEQDIRYFYGRRDEDTDYKLKGKMDIRT